MTGELGAASPLRPHDPRRLGDYELLGRLGEGGMGTVYLARDPTGTRVAVKMVRADLAPDDEFRRRFRSEVNRVREVPPFCTAEVIDADPDHDPPYLVVEFVDGPSLAEVVDERGPLTAANLHSVAIGVATALTAIHGAGVIHRDLKPRNVLLAPGSPKVIDFGIARALEATSGHTGTDQMVGTVAYMAPERFGSAPGTPLTPAADIFAWGSVVAYAGTGRTPFHADSPPATAARILTQPPDLTGLTGPLRDLVDRALAKDPADRPTARQLLEELVTGPGRPAAAASALAHQPGLRAAAAEAQAATGYDSARQLTALAAPPGLDTGSVTRPVITAPAGPVRRRGPRMRLVFLLATLLALIAGGATLAAVSLIPTTAESATADPPGIPADSRIILEDPLSGSHLWQASAMETASCSFSDGLVARRETPGSFRCTGPADMEPADLHVQVDVRLLSRGSCAAIWFRFRGTGGYQVRVCEKEIYVSVHKDIKVDVIRTLPLATPVPIGGAATRIALRIEDETVTVLRDGSAAGTVPLTDPELTGGRVVVGIFTEPKEDGFPPPYLVSFRDIKLSRL